MTMTPKMQIVWEVLEAAKDNHDAPVIAACRRLIWANTLGWRKRAQKSDIAIVWSFA
jgi:hypothetical protein